MEKKGSKAMKKTRQLAALLLTLIFTLVSAACTFANTADLDGHLDSVVGNTISGWLWNPSEPEVSQTVTIDVKNTRTGETVFSETTGADEYRKDLEAKGKGSGNYGFHVCVDWDSLPTGAYTVTLSSQGKTLSGTLSYANGDLTSLYDKLLPLGTFKTTAYCPCYRCSEGWGRLTSSGALATADHTVAVDRRVIPIGSRLLINGQEYIAQDVGGGVKGNHIDIYFNTHAETTQYGVRNAEIYLIQ